jgi:hypothetical protein
LTVGGGFVLLGGLLWSQQRASAGAVLAGLGALLVVVGAVAPGRLGLAYRVWMALARAISRVTTPLLMGVIYFGVLTPIGLLLRAARYDPMNRRLDRHAPTYWVARDRNTPASRYFRQF